MTTWLWFGLVAYLLVGLFFAFKGRLAFMVDAHIATASFESSVPKWKIILFKWLLRTGVVLLYPIFLMTG